MVIIEQLTKFSSSDYKQIKDLASKIGQNYKPLKEQDLKDILISPNSFLFVARDTASHQIIGMLTLLVFRIPYVKKATLEDLIVSEEFRGQGIASKLFDHALQFAKHENASYVDFTSRPRRIGSNKFYQKLGFKPRETNVYRLTFDYAEI